MFPDKYAIIVGKGDLPIRMLKTLKDKNIDFLVAGIKGFSPRCLVNGYPHFWFYIGEVGDLISKLKSNGVNKIIMVGAISRPSLFALRVDSLGKEIIANYRKIIRGDNSILSIVIQVFQSHGLEVVAPQILDPAILVEEKYYTNVELNEANKADIMYGLEVAKEIGKLDIGQSLIVQQNIIIAIEAAEGTKKMILRSKSLLKKNGSKGILIKLKKPGQEDKVDLPVIGDLTIVEARKAGLGGIIVEAQNSIILNQEKLKKLADKYGIFVIGITPNTKFELS
ncbi:hypothetical protein ABSA28_00641 [Candidatus Hepatincolaceae symbiont of Richtersius coronifer]